MHSQAILAAVLGSLAVASARHHTSSYTYSNLETLYTSQTDWQGVVTGQPTSHPPVVTSFPSKILASMQSLQSAHDASALSVQGQSINIATVTQISPGLATLDPGSGRPHGGGHNAHSSPSVRKTATAAAHRPTNHASVHSPSSDSSSGSNSGSGSKSGNGDGGNGAGMQAASVGTMLAAAVAAVLFA